MERQECATSRWPGSRILMTCNLKEAGVCSSCNSVQVDTGVPFFEVERPVVPDYEPASLRSTPSVYAARSSIETLGELCIDIFYTKEKGVKICLSREGESRASLQIIREENIRAR